MSMSSGRFLGGQGVPRLKLQETGTELQGWLRICSQTEVGGLAVGYKWACLLPGPWMSRTIGQEHLESGHGSPKGPQPGLRWASPVTWGLEWCDSFWVPWQMVLVASSRPIRLQPSPKGHRVVSGSVAGTTAHQQQVSYLSMGLPAKNNPPESKYFTVKCNIYWKVKVRI